MYFNELQFTIKVVLGIQEEGEAIGKTRGHRYTKKALGHILSFAPTTLTIVYK